jgi:hypothetical protein
MDRSKTLPRLEIGVGVVIVASDSCLYIIGGISFRAYVLERTLKFLPRTYRGGRKLFG